MPKYREKLEKPLLFISFEWQEAWFCNQKFDGNIYNKLLAAIRKTGCKNAEKCFKTHWCTDDSQIDIPRTNIIAERAVKLMEQLKETCKNEKYLNFKFISKNDL